MKSKSRRTTSNPTFIGLHVSPLAKAALFLWLLGIGLSLHAQVYNVGTGVVTWNSAGSWNPAAIPNSVGASVAYFNAAGASNVVQTTSRTNTLDGGKTVGSISFNNDAANAFSTVISTGTGGPLTFNNGGSGATITVPSVSGTGNFTISVGMSLADSLTVNVGDTSASSAAGAMNLTGTMSGAGGFTKQGDGLVTFGTGSKTYAGPTLLSGGRMRMSVAAAATGTSSFTVNGGQLDVIAAGTITLGNGPLNLNGSGAATGPYAVFPGAIRSDTGLGVQINNAVVLQTDTLLHVEGFAAGFLTFTNVVSGPGKLTFTAPNSSTNLGQLVLGGANTYQGGTQINGGTVVVSNTTGSLGIGDVSVNSAASPGSTAILVIQSGVTNAIADTATLSIAGGATGTVNLGAGVNEVVSALKLAGVAQASGTYGSSTSPAANQSDTYFTGTGIVTVGGVVTPPVLKITSSLPNVILSWPTNSAGFALEQKATANNTTTWATNTNSVVVSGTNNTVTVAVSNGASFFRLIK